MSKRSNGGQRSQSDQNYHANQHNPNNPAHTAAQNNRANQLNPNNSAYASSRSNAKGGKR